MKQSRRLGPAHVVGVAVTAGLICLIAWLIAGEKADGPSKDRDQSTSHEEAAPASESSPVPDPMESAVPVDRVMALEPAVNRFVKTFYYRDASLSESDLRQQLTPLVTASFLKKYPPNLSTESDEWVRQNDGVIEATAKIVAGDAGIMSTRALVSVDVTRIGKANGRIEPPFTLRVQLEMIWQDGWKVTDFG